MADSVNVANWPDSGSQERVAYDLMQRIAHLEAINETAKRSRRYYLELYAQCLVATKGGVDAPPLT